MNLKEKAARLKTDIPAVFIAMRKPETPFLAQMMAIITVGYAMSPIDLIPDFIPVLGYLDDILILPVLVALTVKLIPKGIFESCREEAANLWKNGKPKRWYYALPIVAVWLLVAILILKAF